MSGHPYKANGVHQNTIQSIRVWQTRLKQIIVALEASDPDRAKAGLADLRSTLKPEVYPEFADNLDWLYRSSQAHMEAGKTAEAARILTTLGRLLEGAAVQLGAPRATKTPFESLGK